jgi:YD repeat-containing protein
MSDLLEVPYITDLDDLPVDVVKLDTPGVVCVSAHANDGSIVRVTWDELARSVVIRWLEEDRERLTIVRETATKVSIHKEADQILFRIWSQWQGFEGKLVVRVGDQVSISDVMLRR